MLKCCSYRQLTGTVPRHLHRNYVEVCTCEYLSGEHKVDKYHGSNLPTSVRCYILSAKHPGGEALVRMPTVCFNGSALPRLL